MLVLGVFQFGRAVGRSLISSVLSIESALRRLELFGLQSSF
jgi:hypothetical protein